jgi:hypothetical protein
MAVDCVTIVEMSAEGLLASFGNRRSDPIALAQTMTDNAGQTDACGLDADNSSRHSSVLWFIEYHSPLPPACISQPTQCGLGQLYKLARTQRH